MCLPGMTIITVGDIQGEDVQAALSLTGKGGRAVVTGMGNYANVDVKLNLFELGLLQKTCSGRSSAGSARGRRSPTCWRSTRAAASSSTSW